MATQILVNVVLANVVLASGHTHYLGDVVQGKCSARLAKHILVV